MNFHLQFIPFRETPYDEGFLARTSPINDSSFITTNAESVKFSYTKKNNMQWNESHMRVLLRLYHEYRIIYPYRNKGLTDIGWNKLFLKMKEVFPQDPITLWGCRRACLRQLQKQEEAVSNIAQSLLQTNELIAPNDVGSSTQEITSDLSEISKIEKRVYAIIDLYKEYFKIADVIGQEENAIINDVPQEVTSIYSEEIGNEPLSYLTLLHDQTPLPVFLDDPTENFVPFIHDIDEYNNELSSHPSHLEDQITHFVSPSDPIENSLIYFEATETDKNKEKEHVSIERKSPKQSNTSPSDLEILSQDHSTKKHQPVKHSKNFYIDFDEALSQRPTQSTPSPSDLEILSQDHSTKKHQPVKHSKNFYIDFDKALSQRPTQSTPSPQASVKGPPEHAHGIDKIENVPASTQYPRPSFLMAKLKNSGHLGNTSRIDHIAQTFTEDLGMKELAYTRQLTHMPNSRAPRKGMNVTWKKHHLETLKRLYDKCNEKSGNTGYIQEKDWQMIAIEMSTIFSEEFTPNSLRKAYKKYATNL